MSDVAVIIPTLRRPAGLERALRSVFAQLRVGDRVSAIVVADNDPTGSARTLVERLKAEAPWPLVWTHAPVPGVATARNAGLAATDASLIAFLDDDEAAEPGWLAALLAAQAATGADVVFGPIEGRAPDAADWARPYLERFFGRRGPAADQLVDQPFGCGNSLMVRAAALPGPAPFDMATDQAGGEDDALFSALAARGGRFGWAAEARVLEFAPPHRATMRYALTRAFAYGQGPAQTAARHGRWVQVLRWMMIGAAQTLVWGAVAASRMLQSSPKRAEALDRVARGLGKILWLPGFEPQFYGARELARLERADASAA